MGEDLYNLTDGTSGKETCGQYSQAACQKGPESRKVIWIHDPIGGNGKTTMASWIWWHKHGIYISFESAANLNNFVFKQDPQRIYIIDIPRSKPQNASMNDIYNIAENLKSGIVLNGKYETGGRKQKKAHVVIFSNYLPDYSKLSRTDGPLFPLVGQRIIILFLLLLHLLHQLRHHLKD